MNLRDIDFNVWYNIIGFMSGIASGKENVHGVLSSLTHFMVKILRNGQGAEVPQKEGG